MVMNMKSKHKITGAYAEWDDRASEMRVYLDDGSDNPPALRRAAHADDLHKRLFRAAFIANPRDFTSAAGLNDPRTNEVGWEPHDDGGSRKRAERAARAVEAELARMKARKPPPTDEQVFAATEGLRRG